MDGNDPRASRRNEEKKERIKNEREREEKRTEYTYRILYIALFDGQIEKKKKQKSRSHLIQFSH
jgi:hypothetical protein